MPEIITIQSSDLVRYATQLAQDCCDLVRDGGYSEAIPEMMAKHFLARVKDKRLNQQ